jgi:TatD DNase family protein
MWIDTHCHLDFPWKGQTPSDADMASMIERAQAKGVTRLINVGCDLHTSLAGLNLATEYPGVVWCTLGVHPNEAQHWNKQVQARFRELLEEDRQRQVRRIVAIGEIGLDTFREGAPFDVQVSTLRGQLVLARDFNLPVMIHCRDAFPDILRILKEAAADRVVFHCYSGDLETAKEIWARGWITSFTAVVSYPKNEALREVVRQAPVEQYFIETDAPFLPHQEIRGKRNEPGELVRCGGTVAEVCLKSLAEIAQEISLNAVRFFEIES